MGRRKYRNIVRNTEREIYYLASHCIEKTLILGGTNFQLPVILAGCYGIPVTFYFNDSTMKEIGGRIKNRMELIGIDNIRFIEDLKEIQGEKFSTIIFLKYPSKTEDLLQCKKFLKKEGRLMYIKKKIRDRKIWEIEGTPKKDDLVQSLPDVPEITIGIPTYNRAWSLKKAIESVLSQTSPKWELLIVDDGSTDGTDELVRQYKDERVRYIKQKHRGTAYTRNRIFEEAKTQFILWLDSDDILLPNIVKVYQSIIKKHPKIGVIYCDLWLFDGESVIGRVEYPDYKVSSEYASYLYYDNPLPNPGTAIKKEYFQKVGGYNLKNYRDEDYEFWARLAKENCPLFHVPLPLIKYRIHYFRPKEIVSIKKKKMISRKNVVDAIFSLPLSEVIPEISQNDEKESKKLLYKMEMYLRNKVSFSIPQMVKKIINSIDKKGNFFKVLLYGFLISISYLKKLRILRRNFYRKIIKFVSNKL